MVRRLKSAGDNSNGAIKMGHKRMKRRRWMLSAILLPLFVLFVWFVAFWVRTERQRTETLARIAVPPEVARQNQLAEALYRAEKGGGTEIPADLDPVMSTVRRWTALFERKAKEVDGPEWDAITKLWQAADTWGTAWRRRTRSGSRRSWTPTRNSSTPCARLPRSGDRCRFIRSPFHPIRMPSHLTPLQESARLLRIDAIVRADAGDWERALDDCASRPSSFLRRWLPEPWSLAQGFRTMYANSAYRAIEAAFPPGTLSGEATARLLQALQATAGRETLRLRLQDDLLGSTFRNLTNCWNKGWIPRYQEMRGPVSR